MQDTKVVVTEKQLEELTADMLVFFAIQQDQGLPRCDSRLRALLKPLVKLGDFAGKENQSAIFYSSEKGVDHGFKADRVLVVGLGKKEQKGDLNLVRDRFRCAGGTVGKLCEQYKAKKIVVHIEKGFGLTAPDVAECLAEGILLSDYRFIKYKTEDGEHKAYPGIEKLTFHAAAHRPAVRQKVRMATWAAGAVCQARDMANEPGNGWRPMEFAEYGKALAKRQPLKCRILEKADLKRLGMGGILAVNQGSDEPPKMVILEYAPKNTTETILLVGKGLTFDSGGISLKPAAGMQDMKYDMCGGAAVLAAMQAVAQEQPSVGVVAIVPATDNMAGGSALKPGDIVKHYNKITSEVVNTDAEGRLILADALAYGVEKYAPACVIDIATLTGAVIVALGHHRTGVLGNNDKLVEMLTLAGERSGEPVWRLPLGKEYAKQMESKVADIKNAGGRQAGTITAACYLEKFVGETPWAHLDIAGTAWEFTEKPYIPKGPSGVGVRTLIEFIRNWDGSTLI